MSIKQRMVMNYFFKFLLYIVLIGLAVVMLLPFIWSFITSIRPNAEIVKIPISLIPSKIDFSHYVNLFRDMDWGVYFWNSISVTFVIIFSNLFFCSLAAYAFAKFEFKHKKLLLKIMMVSMMIPSIITLVPQFIVVSKFPLVGGNNIFGQGGSGFVDTFMGIILPSAVSIYGLLFMRQFFLNTPKEIGESARVDGAGELKIFFIYLRMVFPGLMTLGLFTFNSTWNSYLWPSLIMVTDESKWLLSIALKNYQIVYDNNYGPLMAGSIIISLPVILVFSFTQKFLLEKFVFDGIK
ncbi:MAG: ABC-type sugar transport system, permease component [Haloplasmataceae bacterium]|jgi:multiple sugar transport system permease protein|nr:ABC-type sugar transport system, permease component [Haloplasmataceae bacterium]